MNRQIEHRVARCVTLVTLAATLWMGGCTLAAPPAPAVTTIKKPAKVLFVGNSFTYYNDSLHNHLRRLINAGKPMLATEHRLRIMTISGGHLPEHAPAMPAMVAAEDWDAVVLQGHSLGPISADTAGPFERAAIAYDRIIDERGAQTVLFMTWAYEGEPDMTDRLSLKYTEVGNKIGALVVPVGLAFAAATQQHPEIVLRHRDLRHPTLAGTYLAACTFYAALFNASPAGLSYNAGLPADVARQLQTVAQQTALNYYRR